VKSCPFPGVFLIAGKSEGIGLRDPFSGKSPAREEGGMANILALSGSAATILWIIAAILVIYGIVMLVRGAVLQGVLLIVVGLLVGPGGVSIFK
jgi:hypothetical protein